MNGNHTIVSDFCSVLSTLAELEAIYSANEQNGIAGLFESFAVRLAKFAVPMEMVDCLADHPDDQAKRDYAIGQIVDWAREHRFIK